MMDTFSGLNPESESKVILHWSNSKERILEEDEDSDCYDFSMQEIFRDSNQLVQQWSADKHKQYSFRDENTLVGKVKINEILWNPFRDSNGVITPLTNAAVASDQKGGLKSSSYSEVTPKKTKSNSTLKKSDFDNKAFDLAEISARGRGWQTPLQKISGNSRKAMFEDEKATPVKRKVDFNLQVL